MTQEMLRSYFSLRDRIDRFASSVRARYGEHMECRAGCAECCMAGLTLVMVEAVALGEHLGIDESRIHLQAGQDSLSTEGSCAFLGPNALCNTYESRPLVCRTHGLPMRSRETDEISCCHKNFATATPHNSAILDNENMETALFAVNLDYCRKTGINPMSRVAIDRLAALIIK